MLSSFGRKRLLSAVFVVALVLSVCAPLGRSSAGSFPGINGRIVFSKQGGSVSNYTIYTKNGNDAAVALTDGAQDDRQPSWSPDGTKVTFERDEPGGGYGIWYMNADGSSQIALDENNGSDENDPEWSADGTSIIYVSSADGDREIYRTNISTDVTTQITTNSTQEYAPSASPDGTKIAYMSTVDGDSEIYVMGSDGSNITQLTTNGSSDTEPCWTPDGEKILFVSYRDGNAEIYIMDADGGNQTNLTNHAADDNYVSVSPDGQKILFSNPRSGASYDVYEMGMDGSNPVSVVEDDATVDYWASYQPLTLGPTSATPNPTVTVGDDGAVSIDIPSMYTDNYDVVDNSSVAVTSGPASGSTSVDSSTGVITYTQSSVAASNWFGELLAAVFPTASAASATDSFDYEVCSQVSSSLCSTGTITVTLAAATTSSVGVPNTGLSPQSSDIYIILSLSGAVAGGFLVRELLKQRHAKKSSSK